MQVIEASRRKVSLLTDIKRDEIVEVPKGLYGITSNIYGGMGNVDSAKALLEGGVKILQYRQKDGSIDKMIKEAKQIRELCRVRRAVFIVNDHVDLAIQVDADGIHLGQKDMKFEDAKKIAGRWLEGKIVGISVGNASQAVAAQREGASYLGAGSVFPNNTKHDSEVIGLDALKEIRSASTLPIFAIGGIKMRHIKLMKECGIDGIAVISDILAYKDPVVRTREFVNEWSSL
ncbi:MAG: thiamine phosphate synthase [Candidatus Micrarchaeota archaeon]|nr:thiamine phosphate synthase [Candidatus Micrarchaeota archaeon]MDE1833733.1 thiamine phosphate synthase [Candidatus Micrarchaeota archaeon]MDE1859634.1 thiamine phosphate synthase [Candidatus Micrarchaeota archaeon]